VSIEIKPNLQDKYQPFPLTNIQEAYWIGRSSNFELGNVGAHGYYEVDTLNFDLAKLETAWQKLIDRHDMLRVKILDDGSQQILESIPPYKIEVVNLENESKTVVESKLVQIRHDLETEVLDCTQPPLFKIKATKLGEGKIRLHFSYDVLILDGWSLRILFQELFQLYHYPETELSPLQLSFRDYVLALENIKNSAKYEKAKEYWLRRIETLPSRPELPHCKQAKTITKPNFKLVESKLDKASWLKLKQKGAKDNITPSIILLTAFAEILRLWSKNPPFTINLTYFDRLRVHPQIDEIVGDFTSTVLLAVENHSLNNFLSKAKQLQQQLWLDLDHSLFTGVEVLRELAKKQHSNPQALMPIVFTSFLPHSNQENLTTPLMWMGDVKYRSSQTPQVWLDYVAVQTEGELNLSWNFVEDLFPEGMLEGMFSAYLNLLQRLTHEDDIWLESSLTIKPKILPAHQLLADLALLKNSPIITNETLLHQLFTKQVTSCGEKVAIIASDKTLTYNQLSQLVNKVAYGLGELKVQPNQLVAVIMEKGWEQIVAVLAILTAGGAYLPMDAKLPPERIKYILDEAEVQVILTQSTVNLSSEATRDIFLIDEVEFWDYPDTPFIPETMPQVTDLAYVIYTSGSTGQPKGVMIDHRGAVNTILDVNDRFNVKKGDSTLALSALGFDLSVYDIFGTLAVGGTIVLPEPAEIKNPSYWASLIKQHQVTIWNSVPTLIKLMVEYLEDSAFPPSISSLRLVLLSGDWIPVTLPQRIKSLAPQAEIISLGGATEASIWSILYPIDNIKLSWGSIPYGKGMKNQDVYVLDEDLNPCPIWVEGELYISGIGLSLGYWKNPQQTKNSFITHPQTGVRLYRTGDLGRYLPDGNIEFIGRKDFQVKIQGNRVELGEIEAVLRQILEIKEGVINPVGKSEQEKRLIAYLTTSEDVKIDNIRQFLAQRLPDYMIPARFVILEQLPLNSNGKVDRQALPIPSVETTTTFSPILSSVSPQVEKISLLVAEILNLDTVKPDDNWLSLGATSVDMIRIANRLDNDFGFRLSIDQLYQEGNAIAISKLLPVESSLDIPSNSFNSRLKGGNYREYDLILDPQERKLFRERQHGLRNDIDKPVISLSKLTLNLTDYKKRVSIREFTQEVISQAEFSQFLAHLSQIKLNNNPKYLYPSAGSLYAVQTYLFIKPKRIQGIDGGIYYYHPVNHHLVQLSSVQYLDATIYEKLINRPIYQSSAFAMFFIANMDGIAPLYGEYAHDFALIETGAMVQLLMTKAFECNLGICAIGSLDFAKIEKFFDLNEEHLFLHSLLGGKISPETVFNQSDNLSEVYLFDNEQKQEENEREQFEF
jgi:amino acid adenylation domain-containing protein